MILGEKPAASPTVLGYSFNDVVDEACGKLMDKQITYSIRRIQEMEECLAGLERELDQFLAQKNREPK